MFVTLENGKLLARSSFTQNGLGKSDPDFSRTLKYDLIQFAMGDIGMIDPNGNLVLTGRVKDSDSKAVWFFGSFIPDYTV